MPVSGITQNIEELLELLNISENLLRFNASIETEIKKHGGTVLYSYNNIIIASEINNEFYDELNKNPFIESIYEVPLKKYGDIDMSLIDQIDISNLNINLNVVSGSTGYSGSTGSGSIIYSGGTQTGGGSMVIYEEPIAPIITNSGLTIDIGVDKNFTYIISAIGTEPITYSKEIEYTWGLNLSISGNTLVGSRSVEGIANITLKATNNYGYDTKTLVLNTHKLPKITSPLLVSGFQNSAFTYSITDTGSSYSYRAYFLNSNPTGLSISGNTISGVLNCIPAIYEIPIYIIDEWGEDGETLKLIVNSTGSTGTSTGTTILEPIITSPGILSGNQYSTFDYTITAIGAEPITYSIHAGVLPQDLFFSVNKISGMGKVIGESIAILIAQNNYGTSTKQLRIIIADNNPNA